MRRATIAGAFVLLLLISAIPIGSSQATEIRPDEVSVYITTRHAAITIWGNTATHNDTRWTSSLRPYSEMTVWIVGDVSWRIHLADRGEWINGTGRIGSGQIAVTIPVNGSEIWPIVYLDAPTINGTNGTRSWTFNLGVMRPTAIPIETVEEERIPLTITVVAYMTREWKSLVRTAVIAVLVMIVASSWLTRWKRGRVIVR